MLLIAHLAELDARRLYLGEGCSSMHAYCVNVLHLSEHAAYLRIEAARLTRRFPILLPELAAGRLHLTGLARLGPHLTPMNLAQTVAASAHRTRREIERLVDTLRTTPPPPAPARVEVRAVPAMRAAPTRRATAPSAEARPVGMPEPTPAEHPDGPDPGDPTAGGLFGGLADPVGGATPSVPLEKCNPDDPATELVYRPHVTIRPATRAKLDRARALLGYSQVDGDVGEILDRALDLQVAGLERRKWGRRNRDVGAAPNAPVPSLAPPAANPAPSPAPPSAPPAAHSSAARSRHIPAMVKRAVHDRDRERCAFVASNGRRCAATTALEYHHIVPWARRGPATVDNLELRCRAHNQYEAVLDFGGRAYAARRNAAAAPARAPRPVPIEARNSVWTEPGGMQPDRKQLRGG